MYRYLITFLFFLTVSCGIDKDPGSVTSPSTGVNSGELDISFQGSGFVAFDNAAGGNSNDEIFDIAIDSQDRVVGVGRSITGSGDSDMAIWRIDSDGVLDVTFNGTGIFTHAGAAGGTNTADIGFAVFIDANDDIFVAGASINGSGNFDMVVWKVTETGSLDTSFNTTGFVVDDNAAGGVAGNDQGLGITVDGFNKVIVTGFSDRTVTDRDMAIWKFNPTGSFDTGFDTDGIMTDDGQAVGEDDTGNSVVVDAANNIIVAGRSDSVANSGDMAIWRFTSAGVADAGFNGTGLFTHHNAAAGNDFDTANDIVIDGNGDYYATGFSRNSSGNNDLAVWKVTAAGSLDTSFNGTGFNVFDVSPIVGTGSADAGESITLDSTGMILISGSGNNDLGAWRFATDGSLDTTFNTDGYFNHDSAAGGFALDSGFGIALDSQGRLYIGGQSENNSSNNDAVFWRFN